MSKKNAENRYETVYDGIKYGQITDLMSGKGRYEFQNHDYGNFDPFEVLDWLYYFDKNHRLLNVDIKKRFKDALNDFLKDESSVFKTGDLYMAALYFVCQCINEDYYKKSSFELNIMERDHYLLFLRFRIYENENKLKTETTPTGKNKWKEIYRCNTLFIKETKCKVGFLTSKQFQVDKITPRQELVYYAITHNELIDLMGGKGVYYYETSPWYIGSYDTSEVLTHLHFWNRYDSKLNVRTKFIDALRKLVKGNADDVILAKLYFECQCNKEVDDEKASFLIGEDFRNDFTNLLKQQDGR
ncbi:MAG: hypothetical protein ACI4GV_05850 [Acutalibacteraceae bacterium]